MSKIFKQKRAKMGRPPLGKISLTIRVRQRTKDELIRLAAAEQITISDYAEAVLIEHFEALAAPETRR
jgi:hypothetical protein